MKCTVAITLFLLLAQSVSAKECHRSDAIAAERLTDPMTSWRNIYTAYRQYGHCYDGPIAEGVTDKVVHLLATNWESLGQAQQFIAEDPRFQTFVIRNIDITAATPELDRVVYLATHQCPRSASGLCKQIAGAAGER